MLPGGFNPSYIVAGPLYGDNSITLSSTTVPNHTHTATATATQASHFHYGFATNQAGGTGVIATPNTYVSVEKGWGGNTSYTMEGNNLTASMGKTNTEIPVITINSVTVVPTAGGGNAHSNIQPSIACYYIMYIS